jgi:hypothetical protein
MAGWIAALPRRGRAFVWSIVLLALACGAVLWSVVDTRWDVLTIGLMSVFGAAALVCALDAMRKDPAVPTVEEYFDSDLRASGVYSNER